MVFVGGGDRARDALELGRSVIHPRDRAKQPLGVGVPRAGVEVLRPPGLDDVARVHDDDVVAVGEAEPQVVGHQDHRHAAVVLEPSDEVEDLSLRRRVEGGRRLVGDEEPGVLRERSRQGDPLAHSSGQLEGKPVQDLGVLDLHLGQASHELVLGPTPDQRLLQVCPDRQQRVQDGEGVLHEQRHRGSSQRATAPFRNVDHLVALDHRGPARLDAEWQQSREGTDRDRLAAPGLADDAQGLASGHLEARVEGQRPEVATPPGAQAQVRDACRWHDGRRHRSWSSVASLRGDGGVAAVGGDRRRQ